MLRGGFFLLLILASVAGDASSVFGGQCLFSLTDPKVWSGSLMNSFSNSEWQVYTLNRTPGENLVYRYVENLTGRSHVRKVFRSPTEAVKDFDLMEHMRVLLSGTQGDLRVAEVYGMEGSNLFLEDVRGTDLKATYERSKKSRAALFVYMLSSMQQISRAISDGRRNDVHYFSEAGTTLPEMHVIFQVGGHKAEFCVCPENIVLEPNGKLVLIDP